MSQPETRLLQVRPAGTLSMAGARLVVLRGPDKGRAARFQQEKLIVGTAPSADLVLTDPTVSRNHLALAIRADGYLVTDLESTNGTRLDRRRVMAAFVNPGDQIDIGGTRLRLEEVGERIELSLSRAESFGRMIGASVATRRLFAQLEAVAKQDVTVLLQGETGTGKDLAAEGIHQAQRADRGPLVVVDCSAMPAGLIESELFGHEKGAFTGAHARRIGAFEEADGGTLFIDEVGELPKDLQAKLLRALEKREVRPLGSSRTIAVDVRIIAATNRDLMREVNRGLFREDLFFRLAVVTIDLPPLRERPDDIPLLATRFWREITGDAEGQPSADLLRSLAAHSWPGNVRELRNRIERAVVLPQADGQALAAAAPSSTPESYGEAKAQAIEAFERRFLTDLLERAGQNVSAAARLARMDRVYLTKLLRRYGLHRPRFS